MVSLEDLMSIMPLNPFWVWHEWLTWEDYKILSNVCKAWQQSVAQFDGYWSFLMQESWWYKYYVEKQGIRFVLPKHLKKDSSQARAEYIRWKGIYQVVRSKIIQNIYVKEEEDEWMYTQVYGDCGKPVTKYWSHFRLVEGSKNKFHMTIYEVIDHLKDRGFQEVGRVKKNRRKFTRSHDGLVQYYCNNMHRLRYTTSTKIIQ